MPSAAPDDAAPISLAAIRGSIGETPLALFHRTLERLGCRDDRFAIAVSGGPDSVALLLLCATFAGPDHIAVATVDHGIRPESRDEARQVAALCERLAIPHAILRISVPHIRGGPQSAAREARYAALAGWCPGPRLLTAHHRDDVAEGLLMRLARGSGVRGLARMRESTPLGRGGPILVRPLLDWSRSELLAICARAGIATIRDPSNEDPRFDRTAARTVLAGSAWLDPRRLARAATNLAEADEALEWMTARYWAERVFERDGGFDLDPRDLPHDTKRRLVERIVAAFVGPDRDRRVERLVRALDAGEHAMLADIAAIPGAVWAFRRAPPRRVR